MKNLLESKDHGRMIKIKKTTTSTKEVTKFNTDSHIHKIHKLPIDNKRDEIIETIFKNQVTIIAGKTGCGKTTQVPQYLYHQYQQQGNPIKMILTQPRRLAAVSIARRMSKELHTVLGDEVGYQVGLNSNFNDNTKILIVTTGIFLQRLIHNEDLQDLTHIILDEVHERDMDIDFVLILLKHILKKNNKIKLILMSATIMTNLFSNYFSTASIANVENVDYYTNVNEEGKIVKDEDDTCAPVIEIKQGMFENYYVYIEEIINKINVLIKDKLSYLAPFYMSQFNKDDFVYNYQNPYIDVPQYDLCCYLIHAIANQIVFKDESFTTILVFLPGLGEIQNMKETLDRLEHNFDIFQLHSNLNE